MNLYPALKAKMGTWDYYIVKMQMKDIVKEVGFASEIYSNKTLDEAIQRTLNEGRVKKEIVTYLGKRPDRFFSSIVVAALGGNPTYTPVEITDDPKFALLKSPGFDTAFGVLTFDGGQKYFALDGQHRLKAIKTLIEQTESELPQIPENFLNEEVSVIMLVRQEARDAEFMTSYRRIFSSLNRYAKPTDADTNIIMDEDDVIAILTRRLLTEHEFFAWEGKSDTNPKLKTKGKNLKSGEPFFTTLQTLYAMNEKLLTTSVREDQRFASREYKQFRPPEDDLDDLYIELVLYWDALLNEVKILKKDPTKMRAHDAESGNYENHDRPTDNLLFWPIGQEMFADTVRTLLNRRLPPDSQLNLTEIQTCVRVLSQIDWRLHSAPWRGLLIIQDPEKKSWKMRNEDRKRAVTIGMRILRFMIGLDDLPENDLEDLKIDWHAMLLPRPDPKELEVQWAIVSKRLI